MMLSLPLLCKKFQESSFLIGTKRESSWSHLPPGQWKGKVNAVLK